MGPNTRARTKCTVAGLRARTTLGRLIFCTWPEVESIRVEVIEGRSKARVLTVRTAGGKRYRIEVPNSDLLSPDEFATAVRQIQDYWQRVTVGEAGKSDGAGRLSIS